MGPGLSRSGSAVTMLIAQDGLQYQHVAATPDSFKKIVRGHFPMRERC